MPFSLTSLGGAGTVTGSKHLLEKDGRRLLVDCGMFQGPRDLRELNWKPLPIPAISIEAVVLTHAHLDHSGYLPRLVRDGFRGPIYASPATRDLARLILLDSAFLQEKDAEFANRNGFSRHVPALPLYTKGDAEAALSLFQSIPFYRKHDLGNGAQFLLRRAGHILGASTVEMRFGSRSIVFSGDLGRYGDAMMPDPDAIRSADYVVVESTYGNRTHPHADPVAELGSVIERTARRGGTVVIPAFAVGRTQSLLYHLWTLKQRGKLGLVPIYVDSPMATNATNLLCAHMDDHRLPPQVCKDSCDIATYVRDSNGSKALSTNRMPKVIISASGMATGGRVLHHIKAFGGESRNTILFSGFQATGTRGRALVDGAKQVKIHGAWIDIKAEVADLSMLSAHADANEILRWLGNLEKPPARTFVVHGEPDASATLKQRIEKELGWACHLPTLGENMTLDLDESVKTSTNMLERG